MVDKGLIQSPQLLLLLRHHHPIARKLHWDGRYQRSDQYHAGSSRASRGGDVEGWAMKVERGRLGSSSEYTRAMSDSA